LPQVGVAQLRSHVVVLALRLIDEGQSMPQVAAAFGLHETTIYRRLSAAV
jgi:DNA-binding phage protein